MIRSERLHLIPFREEDAPALLEVFQNPDVRRYLLDGNRVPLDWVEGEVVDSKERFASKSAGLWALHLDDVPGPIGFVGFRAFFEPPRLQLLYGLLPEHWGQGLATEAARCACDFAFDELGLAFVEAATDVPNQASVAVLERLGMVLVETSDKGDHGTVFYRIERALGEPWQVEAFATERRDYPPPHPLVATSARSVSAGEDLSRKIG